MRPQTICVLLLTLALSGACQSNPAKRADAPAPPPLRLVPLAVSLHNRAPYALDSVLLNVSGGGGVDINMLKLRFDGIPPGGRATKTIVIDSNKAVVCAVRLYARGEFLVQDAYAARNTTYVPQSLRVLVSDTGGTGGNFGIATIAVRDERQCRYRPVLERTEMLKKLK